MSLLTYSENESRLFGVRFARYEGPLPDCTAMREEVHYQQLDFVRLKITHADDTLFARLHELGFPWHLLDIHRYYWLDTHQRPIVLHNGSGLSLRQHTTSTFAAMQQIVAETFSEMPLGYFRHPVIEKYFPLPLQIKNVSCHIASEFTQTTNPGKQAWFIEKDGQTIGCGATNFMPEEAYTVYIGLLPQHRKKNLYDDVINLMQYTIQQNGARYITGSARLHNLSSQAVFERQGERYLRHDYVIMLMPMLHVSGKPKRN
ncbi:MAG: GNAT family N-acetyltransferase [Chitinophagales bacterium]|nr:GNAT family N-acetyltransferase [Chitinophagales bacterium]MDW8420058.1 hypothetical protein [Chitinophagales bacterium]